MLASDKTATAFGLFVSEKRAEMKSRIPAEVFDIKGELKKMLKNAWAELPKSDAEAYETRAERQNQQHVVTDLTKPAKNIILEDLGVAKQLSLSKENTPSTKNSPAGLDAAGSSQESGVRVVTAEKETKERQAQADTSSTVTTGGKAAANAKLLALSKAKSSASGAGAANVFGKKKAVVPASVPVPASVKKAELDLVTKPSINSSSSSSSSSSRSSKAPDTAPKPRQFTSLKAEQAKEREAAIFSSRPTASIFLKSAKKTPVNPSKNKGEGEDETSPEVQFLGSSAMSASKGQGQKRDSAGGGKDKDSKDSNSAAKEDKKYPLKGQAKPSFFMSKAERDAKDATEQKVLQEQKAADRAQKFQEDRARAKLEDAQVSLSLNSKFNFKGLSFSLYCWHLVSFGVVY